MTTFSISQPPLRWIARASPGFDLDGSSVRLSVLGDRIGLVRSLGATVTTGAADLPVTGFGLAAAELPSVVRKALKERWASLDIKVTPHHDIGTVVQHRTALTDGIPLENSLWAGVLDEDEDDLDRSDLTLCWERPRVPDCLVPADVGINFGLAMLQECLNTADKLIPANADNPGYEVLEFVDGIAHAGTLNLRFCIEAPALKAVNLRLHRSQLRPLTALFERFDPLARHRVATIGQYHAFTDALTTIYTAIPSARPAQEARDVLSNRPNTQAEFQSTSISDKLKEPLRTGRGAPVRYRVLRMQLSDAPTQRFVMEAYFWGSAKRIGRAGKIQPVRSETTFDVLTEQVLVEKALTACHGRIVIQASPEWLYVRSNGQLTQLTTKIRAYSRDHRRLETQVSSLPKLT